MDELCHLSVNFMCLKMHIVSAVSYLVDELCLWKYFNFWIAGSHDFQSVEKLICSMKATKKSQAYHGHAASWKRWREMGGFLSFVDSLLQKRICSESVTSAQ